MIEEKSLWGNGVAVAEESIAKEAYLYANMFLRDYAKMGDRKFELCVGCPPPGCAPSDLIAFLEDNGFVFSPIAIDENDYASWLMPLAPLGNNTGIYVAVDPDQVQRWFEQTGMPVDIQINRILIHEFAHKLFHRRLVASGHEFDGRQGSRHSSPMEEEEAWVFTFFFFTLIMGEYSKISRQRVGVDNTPAHYI